MVSIFFVQYNRGSPEKNVVVRDVFHNVFSFSKDEYGWIEEVPAFQKVIAKDDNLLDMEDFTSMDDHELFAFTTEACIWKKHG